MLPHDGDDLGLVFALLELFGQLLQIIDLYVFLFDYRLCGGIGLLERFMFSETNRGRPGQLLLDARERVDELVSPPIGLLLQ